MVHGGKFFALSTPPRTSEMQSGGNNVDFACEPAVVIFLLICRSDEEPGSPETQRRRLIFENSVPTSGDHTRLEVSRNGRIMSLTIKSEPESKSSLFHIPALLKSNSRLSSKLSAAMKCSRCVIRYLRKQSYGEKKFDLNVINLRMTCGECYCVFYSCSSCSMPFKEQCDGDRHLRCVSLPTCWWV